MSNGPIFIVFNCAIDIWLYNWRTAFDYLAGVYAALASVCGAPVHPGTPANRFVKTTVSEGTEADT